MGGWAVEAPPPDSIVTAELPELQGELAGGLPDPLVSREGSTPGSLRAVCRVWVGCLRREA